MSAQSAHALYLLRKVSSSLKSTLCRIMAEGISKFPRKNVSLAKNELGTRETPPRCGKKTASDETQRLYACVCICELECAYAKVCIHSLWFRHRSCSRQKFITTPSPFIKTHIRAKPYTRKLERRANFACLFTSLKRTADLSLPLSFKRAKKKERIERKFARFLERIFPRRGRESTCNCCRHRRRCEGNLKNGSSIEI